jgi:lipopolysaccharide biosynthesis protein
VESLFTAMRDRFRAQRRLPIVLHLFYDSLATEFAGQIRDFDDDVDVYITVPKDIAPETAYRIASLFPGAYIQEVPNRGRDILPFYGIMSVVVHGRHEFACKLHTKLSPHLRDGDDWRKELVKSLLSYDTKRKLEQTIKQTDIGILCPSGSLAYLGNEAVRRHSSDRIKMLAGKLGIHVALKEPFVAGSMFWFRPAALQDLAAIVPSLDFEPELGQVDGTLAHALERMTIIAASAAGFKTAVTDTAPVAPRQY